MRTIAGLFRSLLNVVGGIVLLFVLVWVLGNLPNRTAGQSPSYPREIEQPYSYSDEVVLVGLPTEAPHGHIPPCPTNVLGVTGPVESWMINTDGTWNSTMCKPTD